MESENALATVEPRALVTRTAVQYLGELTKADFSSKLETMKAGQDRLELVKRTIMREGHDYGTIEGIAKPTLYKPGAEKLLSVFGLVCEDKHEITYGDGSSASPWITVISTALIKVGDFGGPIVAKGSGACSTHERKYRYRAAGRACPQCQISGKLMRARYGELSGKGWYCNAKRGGCGETTPDSHEAFKDSKTSGATENEDPFELLNTVLKMSAKRALVAGALLATASSGSFTQDLEEEEDDDDGRDDDKPKGKPGRPTRAAANGNKGESAQAVTTVPPEILERVAKMDRETLLGELDKNAAVMADAAGIPHAEIVSRYSYTATPDKQSGRKTMVNPEKASEPWLRWTLANMLAKRTPQGSDSMPAEASS
jgi:hypothetical protein